MMPQRIIVASAFASVSPLCEGSAFPDGDDGTSVSYTLTVPSAKVPANQTGFPVAVDLSRLPAAFWTALRYDGGNLRAYEGDGTTPLPREIQVTDYATGQGWAFVKMDISSSSDTDFVLKVEAGQTEPAVGSTYGRNAVWSAYEAVFHLLKDTVDSSGNHSVTDVIGETLKRTGLFAATEVAPDIDCHQGIIWTGSHWIGIDTDAIRKFDTDWSLVSQNTSPFTGLSGSVNHLGDGDYKDGKLYIPVENWAGTSDTGDGTSSSAQQIAVYDADTLALVGSHDISGEDFTTSAACWDPDRGDCGEWLVAAWAHISGVSLSIRRYSSDFGTYLGEFVLSEHVPYIQGIAKRGRQYYVSQGVGGGSPLSQVKVIDRDGTVLRQVITFSTTIAEGVAVKDGDLYLLFDEGTSERVYRLDYQEGLDIDAAENGVSKVALGSSSAWSMSVIVNQRDATQRTAISLWQDGTANTRATLANDDGDKLGVWFSNGASWLYSGVTPVVLQDYYMAVAAGSGSRTLVANEATTSGAATDMTTLDTLFIGAEDADTVEPWLGRLRHVRAAAQKFTANWLLSEKRSLLDPDFVVGNDYAEAVMLIAATAVTYGSGDSVTTVSRTVPAAAASGDLIVAALMHRAGASGITAPSGFAREAQQQDPAGGTEQFAEVWTKTAGPSDAGTNLTFTGAVSGRMALLLLVLRAPSGVVVEDTAGANYSAAATTNPGLEVIPSVSSGGSGRLLLGVTSCVLVLSAAPTTYTFEPGWLQHTPVSAPTTPTQERNRFAVATKSVGIGPTATSTVEHGVTSHEANMLAVLFRPT